MTESVLIAEGKTKEIWSIPEQPGNALIRSKNDITAGDGAKHDVLIDKAVLATTTTVNVFKLLQAAKIPVAYIGEKSETEFIARYCNMLPYEVVVRRLALGSYLKRNLEVQKGTRFEALVVEFYLKTSGKIFEGVALPKDDPLITNIRTSGLTVHDPSIPIEGAGIQIPHTLLGWKAEGGEDDHMDPFGEMEKTARQVFLVLEKAWAFQRHTLVDLKIEFGFPSFGKLVVADVIDNDSWRVLTPEGTHIDKQLYRDNADLPTVSKRYKEVAEHSQRFVEHIQPMRVTLWTASTRDPVEPFHIAFKKYGLGLDEYGIQSGSLHKEPETMLPWIKNSLWNNLRDQVMIVYVGRSNGAGPVIAASTHVPVITVPNIPKESTFGALSVISSLDMPSDVPVMTIIEPANAVLAALNILGMKNPRAYMLARSALEKRKLHQGNSPTHGRFI